MFPHADQPLSRVFRGRKMQVGKFRHRVPKRLVDAACHLPPLNMCDRDVHMGTGYGRREIGPDVESRQNEVGTETLEEIDQPGKNPADGNIMDGSFFVSKTGKTMNFVLPRLLKK